MQQMTQKDWDRLSEIAETIEEDSHKAALQKVIKLGKAHALLNEKFNELLSQERTTANRADIDMHMDALNQWIFYILPQKIPLPVLGQIHKEIRKQHLSPSPPRPVGVSPTP